jgi:hypothetical protein
MTAGTSKRLRLMMQISAVFLLPTAALGALVLLRPPAPHARAASGGVPAGLPTHFSFGLMDGPGGATNLANVRTNNGTAWDYRYQYLSAGANTGNGWATWNSPAGAFATYYMQDSDSHGIMPAFVYYQMLQSNGPSGGSEAGNDLAHLNSAGTMRAYFADWALLMQKIGAFGKPALVVVEPDLWGFVEQNAIGRGASSVPASVAISGYADAQGYPNTAQGFSWALLHIRDKYAKNAILALHSSSWGSGTDIASNTSGSLNAAGIGQQEAQFLNSAGIVGNPAGVSTWDAISNDIADHDSGQSGNWWDPTNRAYPNFNRYLRFAAAVSSGTSRRILMWQVPVGNQYFDTENNSQGHTQDNKAQYILGHVADFANAGVIGVLFGPGNGGTNATDVRRDGVTNPVPISTYQCNMCNDHQSQYPDDDGGYLRIYLGQYYKSGGYNLGSGGSGGSPTPTPTPTPPSGGGTGSTCTAGPRITYGGTPTISAARGTSATLSVTFSSSCSTKGLVDFEVYSSSARAGQVVVDPVQLGTSQQTVNAQWLVPPNLATGTYTLKAGVFKSGWGTLYSWNNNVASIRVS